MQFYLRGFAVAVISILLASDSYALTPQEKSKHMLTCKKLDYILIHHPTPQIRPYCDLAEIRCKFKEILDKRPKDDFLRKEIEAKFNSELRYLLDICEVAFRELDPEDLDARPETTG